MESVPGARLSTANYAAPPVLAHGKTTAYVVPAALTIEIDRPAFSLLGNGGFNFYHWLVELLPRIRHFPNARKIFPDALILVPRSVEKTSQLREALELIAPPLSEIFYVDPEDAVLAHTLLLPPHASLSVFNKRGRSRFEPNDFYFDRESIVWLREQLRPIRDSSGPTAGNRVFLARRNDRRSYNQNEMFALFEPHGFIQVFLEDLTLAQQARLLGGADAVAGPTGASWSNLIFCRPGTTAFYWRPAEYGEFRAFDDLAAVSGVNFITMTYRTGAKSTASLYQRESVVPIGAARKAFGRELAKLE
jgi:capsular polysaccharide biosynthesis protein